MKAILSRATAVLSVLLASLAWSTFSTAQPAHVTPNESNKVPKVRHVEAYALRECFGDACTAESDTGCSIILYENGEVECTD